MNIIKAVLLLIVIFVGMKVFAIYPFDGQSYLNDIENVTNEFCACDSQYCRDTNSKEFYKLYDYVSRLDLTSSEQNRFSRAKSMFKTCNK